MNLNLIFRVLRRRSELRHHDKWTRQKLLDHQNHELKLLREYAYKKSPFYRKLHCGKFDAPLSDLPVVTKSQLMNEFDQVVTNPRMSLKEVEAHISKVKDDQLFMGKYRVCATAGTTGRRGIFPFDQEEWANVVASFSRTYEWAGVRASLLHWTNAAVLSSRNPLHSSARVGASVNGPWMPVLRLDALDPLPEIVQKLNDFNPKNLIAYASMLHVLTGEASSGRLRIRPRVVISASEILSRETSERVKKAWNVSVNDVYAATEPAGMASPCPERHRSHLYEDLVITEVVDENNGPVPNGTLGAKVLVTVLFSRTLPLIRYEMSDRISIGNSDCECGRPYKVMDHIEGRTEDSLVMPKISGGTLLIHPNTFHAVFESLPLDAWQVVQLRGSSVRVLVVPAAVVELEAIKVALLKEFARHEILDPQVSVEKVVSIPRTAIGKVKMVVREQMRSA